MSTVILKPVKFRDWIRQEVREARHPGICTCGRIMGLLMGRVLSFKPHCPKCGSGWTIAHTSVSCIVQSKDLLLESTGHKCRKCGHEFHEFEAFESCEAGPTRDKIRQETEAAHKAAAAEAALGMPVDNFKAELNKLRIARGEEPL